MFLSGHGTKGGCTKEDYVEQVLKPVVAKVSEETQPFYGYPLLFHKDGNKIHGLKGAHSLSELKEDLGIWSMEYWPPSSPDFNPMEHVWLSLKQRFVQRGPWLRLEDLKNAFLEEWERPSLDEIRRYICTMPA